MKKTFLGALLAGTVLTGCCVALQGGLAGRNMLISWTDGTSAAGMLLLLAAGVMALNRKGMLDIFAYALFQARYLLLRRKSEEYMSYHDFKLLRERANTPVLAVVLAGVLFLIAGIILTMIYCRRFS